MNLVHPLIDPVILSFGVVQIRWYSMAYILGFFIGLFLVKNINDNFASSLKKKLIDDFFIWAVVGIIIGVRLGYTIFYQIESTIIEEYEKGYRYHDKVIRHAKVVVSE